MSLKPLFVATHPRACSTAFERVFMTRRETLRCVHEPFGDAFYYGPERLSARYEDDEEARVASGFEESTYKTILDRFAREGAEGQRLFIKDMVYYLMPADRAEPSIAPSLQAHKRGVGTETNGINGTNGQTNGIKKTPYPYNTPAEPHNPTIIPIKILERFHFAFLIRDPHSAIPSYYRCTVPPLDDVTGFYNFMPNEAGYDELRRFFDWLRLIGEVGPHHANRWNSAPNGGKVEGTEICVVDADDLLDDPAGIVQVFCNSTGIKYEPEMLNWDTEEDQAHCKEAFAKWHGFHEDAINSKALRPRTQKKAVKSEEQWDKEWKEKYGEKAAKVIRKTVDDNMADYLYLKQFAVKV